MTSAVQAGTDLPPELQDELRRLAQRGHLLSHYELLGIGVEADAAAIRRAYLSRSRRYHPDAWYGRNLGEFGPLLGQAFQALTAAYQTLSDEDSRAGYDREHREHLAPTERIAVDRRAEEREDEERRAQERRQRLLMTKGLARIGAARKLYEEALAHVEKSQRGLAIQALKAARELDPQRKEIADKLAALEREAAKARAASALGSGQEREAQGRPVEALAAYTAAFQMDPTLLAAALGAARCALLNNDARLSSTWGARAVELKPLDLDNRLLLARALIKAQLKVRAKAELQYILTRRPDFKEAKALLKGL